METKKKRASKKSKALMVVLAEPDERLGLPSASGMDADIRCLGRRNLCNGIPNEGSAASRRGDTIHAALEGKIDVDTLTASDKKTYFLIANAEARCVSDYGFEGAEVHREIRMWCEVDGLKQYSGKPDVTYLLGDSALVINYKTGWSETVPVANNYQVMCEASVVRETFKVNRVIGVLIHPHYGESSIEVREFSGEALDKIKEIFIQAKPEMEAESAPRTPNVISCKWCPAKNHNMCKEASATVELAVKKSGDLTSLTPGQITARLDLFEVAKKIIEAERDAFEEMAKNGVDLGKWGMSVGSKKKIIKNDGDALNRVECCYGKEGKDYCSEMSISALEDYLSITYKLNERDAKSKAMEVLGDLVEIKSNKSSLKRLS